MLPDGPEGSLRDAGHPGVVTGGAAGPHPWAQRVMSAEETEGPRGRLELETQVDPRRDLTGRMPCGDRVQAQGVGWGCQVQTARAVQFAVHWGLGVGGGEVPVRGVSEACRL